METISFHCSSCNQALKVATDKAGRKVRCVRCKNIMVVPASAGMLPEAASTSRAPDATDPGKDVPTRSKEGPNLAPRRPAKDEAIGTDEVRGVSGRRKKTTAAEAQDEAPVNVCRKRELAGEAEDEDAVPKRGKRKRPQWRKVHVGLTLLTGAGAFAALGAAVAVIFMFLPMSVELRILTGAGSWSWLLVMAGGVASVASLTGYACCLYLPPLYYVRPLTITLLICVWVLCAFSAWAYLEPLISAQPPDREVQRPTPAQVANIFEALRIRYILILVFTFTLIAVQPFFLRAVARCAKAEASAENCFHLMKLSAGNVAAVLLFLLLLQLALRFEMVSLARLLQPLMWVILLLGLALAVFNLLLLVEIRLAVGDLVGRRSRGAR
jgi:hypothetical protein